MIARSLALAIAVGMAPLGAYADVKLTYKPVVSESAPDLLGASLVVTPTQAALYAAGDQVPSLLFNLESREVLFIDNAYSEYTVMTESWLKDSRAKAEAGVERMREQMEKTKKDLAPRLRQQYDQANTMMKFLPLMGGMTGDDASQLEYSASTRSMTFNDVRCTQLDESYENEKTRVFCVSNGEAVGVDATHEGTVEAFFSTLGRLSNEGVFEYGFEQPAILPLWDGYGGIPLAVSHPDGSGFVLEMPVEVTEGDQVIEVPSNYLEAQIPMMGF